MHAHRSSKSLSWLPGSSGPRIGPGWAGLCSLMSVSHWMWDVPGMSMTLGETAEQSLMGLIMNNDRSACSDLVGWGNKSFIEGRLVSHHRAHFSRPLPKSLSSQEDTSSLVHKPCHQGWPRRGWWQGVGDWGWASVLELGFLHVCVWRPLRCGMELG